MQDDFKIKVVSKETLVALYKCFSSVEELQKFLYDMIHFSQNVVQSQMLLPTLSVEDATVLALKQLCGVALFYRENIEVINELIKKLEFSEFTKEQLEEMDKE